MQMLYTFDKSSHVCDKNETQRFKRLLKKSYPDIRFYKILILIDEVTANHKTVNIGDAVLVASEGIDSYVAKIEALYAIGDVKVEEKLAVVSWFFKQDEIAETKLPSSVLNNEIFLYSSKMYDSVDAETIIDTCSIYFDSTPITDAVGNVFVCRKSYNGRKFKEITGFLPNILHKSFSNSTKRKPNANISRKSIRSTLMPEKNSSKTNFSSPISASSYMRMDANAVALDILQSDSDDDESKYFNRKTNIQPSSVLSSKENFQTSSKATKSNTVKRGYLSRGSTKPITTEPLQTPSHKSMSSEVRVSVKRLEETTKENNFSDAPLRRSSRLSRRTDSKRAKTRTTPFPDRVSNRVTSDYDSDSSDLSSDHDDDDASFDEKAAAKHESASDSESDFSCNPPQRKKLVAEFNPRRKPSRPRRRTSAIDKSRTKTPKNRRPFIPDRKAPVKLAANDFDEARQRLHVSAVPESLPCREEEFQSIYSFIEGKIKAGTGGCMYISGVPGTGKTATVMEVLSCLRHSVAENLLEDFDYIDINGMRLTEPRQAYVSILNQLKGVRSTSEQASELLTKHFNMRGKKPTLLLVDELDLLWTRKQDVLYHIFDWPSHRHARLIVVAIANTMDLPERVMMSKVSSRLGLTRLSFLPYSFKQLQEIITSRLHGLPVFEPDAVQLVARKVAAVSGDARRCLDVCRRAIEIADRNRRSNSSLKATSIDQVHEAIQEMFASPIITLIRNCSIHEKLFLRSVIAEFRRRGLEEATLSQVLDHHSTIAQVEGLPPSSVASIMKVCIHLASCRLLLLEMASHDLYARIRLNVSVDDVLFALNTE